jgi:hypothetical protein
MKEKIRIADILTALEQGLIDRKQAESKLFDLYVVVSSNTEKIEKLESDCRWLESRVRNLSY